MAKNKERERLLKVYGRRYSKVNPVNRSDAMTCYYCGEMSSCYDHVPPLVHIQDCNMDNPEIIPVLVPSCSECNGHLGSKFDRNIYERMNRMKYLFLNHKKYKRLSNIVDDNYLNDFKHLEKNGMLDKQVRNHYAKGIILMDRIDYQGFEFYLSGGAKSDEDLIESEKIIEELKTSGYTKSVNYEYGGKNFRAVSSLIAYVSKIEGISSSALQKEFNKTNNIYESAANVKTTNYENTMVKLVLVDHKESFSLIPKSLMEKFVRDNWKRIPTKHELLNECKRYMDKYLERMGVSNR